MEQRYSTPRHLPVGTPSAVFQNTVRFITSSKVVVVYVLEMLKVKEGRFGGLDDDSPKVKWMRRVFPRADYKQTPWTIVMLRQLSRSIHTSWGASRFRRRFFVGPSLGGTAEVVSSAPSTEFDSMFDST